ncbi:MAG: response regulator [bacterium]|nr:response regulator [bacterium]
MAKVEKRVLIVDDEIPVLDLMEDILTEAKFSVARASNAEETYSILHEEHIQVMFVDLNLPDVTGIDICKQLREDNPIAFIYAITGHIDTFDVFDCRHFGFDDFFEKPFSPKDIVRAAKDAFRKLKRWNHD